jgi:hypothetical protein
MIEMRVVLHKNRINPEIQYRYKNQLSHGCIAPPDWKEWSEWKTAEWVKAETLEELAQ